MQKANLELQEAIDEAMEDVPGYATWAGRVSFFDTSMFIANLAALGYKIVKDTD